MDKYSRLPASSNSLALSFKHSSKLLILSLKFIEESMVVESKIYLQFSEKGANCLQPSAFDFVTQYWIQSP
jgi:hypothetical protein